MSEISCKENENLNLPNPSAQVTSSSTPSPNDLKRTVKIQELPSLMNNHITPAGISRERSFVRASNPQSHHMNLVRTNEIFLRQFFTSSLKIHSIILLTSFQNINKRRSMGFQQQQQQMRKPLEIYRPPSKGIGHSFAFYSPDQICLYCQTYEWICRRIS